MKRFFCLFLILAVFCQALVFTAQAAGEYRTWTQSDSRWGSIQFGATDTMSKTGCAVTAIAKLMVHSGAVADDETVFNPGIFCQWLIDNNGFYQDRGWIMWGNAAKYSSKFSYHGEYSFASSDTQETKTNAIASYIDQGYVIVAQVKSGGHYVAVDKVSNGKVLIMDSYTSGPTELFGYSNSGILLLHLYKGPHNGQSGSTTTPSTQTYDTTIDPLNYTITASGGVNLRSEAGTSYDVVSAIPYNTTVQVTETKNGWGKTTYSGKTGWFSLDYAKTVGTDVRGVQVTAPTKTTYYVGESLNTAGMKVTVLYQNNTSKTITSGYTVSGMPATSTGQKTVYITYGGKSAKFTVTVIDKPSDALYCVITSSNGVNLRSGAGTSYSTVGGIPHNAGVTVTEISNGWGKTTYNGTNGWFSLDYCYAIGDVDSSLSITANDSLMILKNVVGKTQSGFHKTAADANRDGKVKAEDALLVLQRVVGKISILKAKATPISITPTDVVESHVTPTESTNP